MEQMLCRAKFLETNTILIMRILTRFQIHLILFVCPVFPGPAVINSLMPSGKHFQGYFLFHLTPVGSFEKTSRCALTRASVYLVLGILEQTLPDCHPAESDEHCWGLRQLPFPCLSPPACLTAPHFSLEQDLENLSESDISNRPLINSRWRASADGTCTISETSICGRNEP